MLLSVHFYLCGDNGFAGLTTDNMIDYITEVPQFSTHFSLISLAASGWPVKLILHIRTQSLACVDKYCTQMRKVHPIIYPHNLC